MAATTDQHRPGQHPDHPLDTEAGATALSAPKAGTGSVPKRLLQFWDKEPSPDVRASMDRTRATCEKAGLEHVVLDEASGADFLGRVAPDALAHYRRATHPAMKCDILRLFWLHDQGGYYCDCDLVLTTPLPETLPAKTVLFCNKRVANAFMYSEAGAPAIAFAAPRLVRHLTGRLDEKTGVYQGLEKIANLSGPGILTRLLRRFHEKKPADASVLYLNRDLRNRYVTPARRVLGHDMDYKTDDRNWHLSSDESKGRRKRKAG